MEKYLGVKLIEAEQKTHGEYTKIKYCESNPINTEFSKENVNSAGYMVKYDNNYISWSPKDVFEKAYFKLEKTNNTICQTDVDLFIKDVKSIKQGEKTTVTTVTLINGFEIFEASSCVDPDNFDMSLGEQICLGKIKDKIWNLLGFLLQTGVAGIK